MMPPGENEHRGLWLLLKTEGGREGKNLLRAAHGSKEFFTGPTIDETRPLAMTSAIPFLSLLVVGFRAHRINKGQG
jgi:hypothetical protein